MINQDLSNIIRHHYHLQYGCFFSELVDTHSALYSFNDVMECFIWNHVFPYKNGCDLKHLIVDSERYFLTRARKPCVYLDEYNNKQENVEVLSQAGYKCVDNEAWLIYPYNKAMDVSAVTLDPVEINQLGLLNEFCVICSECFGEQYRRKGYARDLMQHLINEAFRTGSDNTKLILQCDGGGFIEEMYLKLGFENLYRRWGYLKEWE